MIFGLTQEQYEQMMEAARQSWGAASAFENARDPGPTATAPSGMGKPQPERFKLRRHEELGIHEWIQLMRDLGYWDTDPEITTEEFWRRVTSWEESLESQLASAEPQQTAASQACSLPNGGPAYEAFFPAREAANPPAE